MEIQAIKSNSIFREINKSRTFDKIYILTRIIKCNEFRMCVDLFYHSVNSLLIFF